MGKVSNFQEIYLANKSEIDSEAEHMTQLQFMSKYHIGSEKYNMYFRGVSKVIKMRVSKRMDERVEYLKQRHEQIKKNAQARQYDDRTEYYLTIEDIAKRNHVTIDIVKKASEEYTLSELKTAKFVNGKAICTYKVEMKKPLCIEESMCAFQTEMI